jgi:L-lactate dehydrogenase complex protein LldE
VVSPSASCVGMVREQYPRLAEMSGDAGLATAVEELRPRVLAEILAATEEDARVSAR